MLAWVNTEHKLKQGQVVIGKDNEAWKVEHVYDLVIERTDLHTDWKVGGLG